MTTLDQKTPAPGQASKAGSETWEVLKTIVYALLIAVAIRTLFFQPYTIPSASEEPNLYEGDYIIVSKWSYGYSRHSLLFSPPIFNGRWLGHAPTRGDVIVFKLPGDWNKDYIKRLIGLPGDRIQMRGGRLFINDKALPERQERIGVTNDTGFPQPIPWVRETNPEGRTYLTQRHTMEGPANNTGVYVVPPHCYFMMGDNRDNSQDSRFYSGLSPEDPKLKGCGGAGTDFLPASDGVGFVPEENLEGKAQIIILSWKQGSNLFNPLSWFNLRGDRFFKWIH
jgi:signal peptidase I